VAAGQSLGAGQAALIGMRYGVARVGLFGGWTDAKHGWAAIGATPQSKYFGLIHQRDNFFERTCYAYAAFAVAGPCPLDGFSLPPALPDPMNPLLHENQQPPFGTQLLVTALEPSSLVGVVDPYHTSTTRDGWIPREPDGTPSQKLLNAWRFVFGDSDADTYLDQRDNCALVANTAQTDADGDGIGDACDPSPRGPAGQISDLIDHTLAALDLPALAPALKASLEAALFSVLAHNPRAACVTLRVYELLVALSPASAFTADEKQSLIAESRQIQADLGCT
jgi:hypothetical protein